MGKYRTAFAVGAAITAAVACASTPAAARDFTIASWGGNYEDYQTQYFFHPFGEQEKINVLTDVYLGGWGPFAAMQDTGVAKWDVVETESAEVERGCQEGFFVKLDWSKIIDKSKLIPQAEDECGSGVGSISMLISYNPKFEKTPVTSIADFFDLKKIPGKRAMRDDPKVDLEFALMASGVEPADVYKVLRSPGGVDRAFAELDKIKSEVQWWKSGDQPINWLVKGDVVLAEAYSTRVIKGNEDNHSDLQMFWDKGALFIDDWSIPASSPHIDEAYAFLKFYYAHPDVHIKFLEVYPNGTVLKGLEDQVPPNVRPLLPMGKNIETNVFTGSADAIKFWADNRDMIQQRWVAWQSQK